MTFSANPRPAPFGKDAPVTPFDNTICALGEGPLWHPLRQELFWFDITGNMLFARNGTKLRSWRFETNHSAAGWVDESTLIIASEDGLYHFDIGSGARRHLVDLEADVPANRSNDGRADPWGGFWIGTMGKKAEKYAGAIYRYWQGELRRIASGITVSNTICFAPDRSCAYYSDTVGRRVMQVALDPVTGWPDGAATVFLDLREAGLNPDGAVTDAAGNVWIACWGSGIVACFSPQGTEKQRLTVPAQQPSCPAFGGPALRDLFVTSATQGLSSEAGARVPLNGATFCLPDVGQGRAEPQVIL